MSGSVEITQVWQALNEMMAALKEAETLRQNMVADAAHELYTPLSVLQVNALRHTPSGGTVTGSVAAAEDAVEISVSDTGEGIAPEDLAYVFERFWRADPTRARSDGDVQLGSGAGLGLAVAQSLVEAQEGASRWNVCWEKGRFFGLRYRLKRTPGYLRKVVLSLNN